MISALGSYHTLSISIDFQMFEKQIPVDLQQKFHLF